MIAEVAVIAWKGDIKKGFYVVPASRVQSFMDSHNHHNNWVVISPEPDDDPPVPNCYLSMD